MKQIVKINQTNRKMSNIEDLVSEKKKLTKELNKINKAIKANKSSGPDLKARYDLLKDDFKRHVREKDGKKVFRGVVDYLECYVKGIPPVARSNFFARFGITGRRAKVTPDIVQGIKNDLAAGKTLQASADAAGVSIATAVKVKKGDYDS